MIVFENSQNSCSCHSPFGLFWSVKYLNFWPKLPIRTAHHTFLESRHPEVIKNPYYVLFPKGAKKGISSWTTTKSCLYLWTSFWRVSCDQKWGSVNQRNHHAPVMEDLIILILSSCDLMLHSKRWLLILEMDPPS